LTLILHIFDDKNSGEKERPNAQSKAFHAFRVFFSEELVSQIAGLTNDHYKHVKDHRAFKIHSSLNNWQDA
jgi:hypothetical protein